MNNSEDNNADRGTTSTSSTLPYFIGSFGLKETIILVAPFVLLVVFSSRRSRKCMKQWRDSQLSSLNEPGDHAEELSPQLHQVSHVPDVEQPVSDVPQSVSSVTGSEKSIEEKLMELRAKMQERRRLRTEQSLSHNTGVRA